MATLFAIAVATRVRFEVGLLGGATALTLMVVAVLVTSWQFARRRGRQMTPSERVRFLVACSATTWLFENLISFIKDMVTGTGASLIDAALYTGLSVLFSAMLVYAVAPFTIWLLLRSRVA